MRFTVTLYSFKRVGDLTKKYSNLPDSYIKRSMEQIVYRTPRTVNYLRREVGKKTIEFTEDRPWTLHSRLDNPLLSKAKTQFVEPIREWTVFRGDRVEILTGKDKGKHGIVCQIIQELNWVYVEGRNCKLKVLKERKGYPSLVIQEEKPLRVTDEVALVDPSDMLPCKVEWRYTEKGEKVRVSTRTARIIPMPQLAEETYDYKTKDTYQENPKDTTKDEILKITFKPKLSTFEMDIMEEMGIKEERQPAPFFWY